MQRSSNIINCMQISANRIKPSSMGFLHQPAAEKVGGRVSVDEEEMLGRRLRMNGWGRVFIQIRVTPTRIQCPWRCVACLSIWHIVLCRSLCEFWEITISVRELKVRYTSTLVVQWRRRRPWLWVVVVRGSMQTTNGTFITWGDWLIWIDWEIYSCMYSFLVHLIPFFLPWANLLNYVWVRYP